MVSIEEGWLSMRRKDLRIRVPLVVCFVFSTLWPCQRLEFLIFPFKATFPSDNYLGAVDSRKDFEFW